MPVFIKDDKSILFVHVPKTGGSSIEQSFADSGYETHFLGGPRTLRRLRRCTPQHMHARMLRQTFRLGRFDLIFMLVREPLARFRSEYGMQHKHDVRTDRKSVEEWAERVFTRYEKDNFAFDNHLRPQAEFLLPNARVFRLEDGLDRVVEQLNADHGLGLVPPSTRVRDRRLQSGVASTDVEISRRLAKRVRNFYDVDYRTFGY